ncbi:MAG TPA: hypothetical protein VMT30_04710 [Candidatus Saccharimonadia bacterium]|nr:hypothetical protein [Candidatus Saccharimonadia bacterium]
MSQRGAINLVTVIAVVLGLGLLASMYLNYSQHQSAQQDRKQLQGEITDLRYQVKQDQQAAAGPSPTPSPLATPEPSPTATPAVAGTSSIAISQYGVKLTVADPIADLTYNMVKNGQYTVAGLSTRALLAKYPACAPAAANNALGQIVQKRAATGVTSTGKLVKQIGVFNYYYIEPTGFCTADPDGRNALAAARAAFKNASLPTLSN